MQSLSNGQWRLSQNQKKKFRNLHGDTKDPEQPNNPKKKNELEQPGAQIISQSHSNRDSTAPAQKQTHRSVEQDSKIESPETNLTPTVSPPPTKRQEHAIEKSTPPQQAALANQTATRKSTSPSTTHKDPKAPKTQTQAEMTKPPEKAQARHSQHKPQQEPL